jgi:hypothetical protein
MNEKKRFFFLCLYNFFCFFENTLSHPFFSVYNNVKTPSILESGFNYRLFRATVEPKWEDEASMFVCCLLFWVCCRHNKIVFLAHSKIINK